MSKVILLGDPHIGKNLVHGRVGIGSALNSRIVDQINLLDWTLDQAVESHTNHIIITGDVYEDPKPSPLLIALFISWLKKCLNNNINVHIIMGNHDLIRSGNNATSPLDIISEIDFPNVTVYKDLNTIIIGTSAFTIVPFRDRKFFGTSSAAEALISLRNNLSYELASIPLTYKKFLIGHLAIEGSIPVGDEIDDLTNEIFCPLDMFDDYDYVWMGHVHKPQVMKKINPYIAHIGSMDISNFGETEHNKHIVIINVDTGDPMVWEAKKLPTRKLTKVNITIPQNTEDSTEYVLNELKKINSFDKSIVKIDVSLESPDLKSINKSIIEKYLTTRGTFNVAGITESKKAVLLKKYSSNLIDTKMDVVSAIKTYSNAHIEAPVQSEFIELALEIHNIYKLESKE